MVLMFLVMWLFHRVRASRAERFFKIAQLASSGFLSLAHGSNDAQKTMGVIMALLIGSQKYFANETGFLRFLHVQSFDNGVPKWIEIGAYTAIALGTLFGGWRIVHTMGSRITKLRPVGGFCAETAGASVIYLASHYGIPVSTTHTITGAIVGVGSTQRLSAVRWGIAGRIVWAWVLTIPAAAIMAAVSYWILDAIAR
jgi:PiT family inorganic phosphate transporter